MGAHAGRRLPLAQVHNSLGDERRARRRVQPGGASVGDVARSLQLALLAPDLVEAILEGTQPIALPAPEVGGAVVEVWAVAPSGFRLSATETAGLVAGRWRYRGSVGSPAISPWRLIRSSDMGRRNPGPSVCLILRISML